MNVTPRDSRSASGSSSLPTAVPDAAHDPFALAARDPFAADPLGGTEASSFHIADYLQILKRRWRLVAVVVVLSLGAAAVRYSITPREYRAETQIQIERRSLNSLASSQSNSNPWLEGWWNLEYYPTQYRLLQSRGLAERVVRNLRLADDAEFNRGGPRPKGGGPGSPTAADDEAVLGSLAGSLLGGLEINPIANTQLVSIAYRSQSPRLAAAVANGFAEAFIEWGIEGRSETVGRASSFLEKQVGTLKEEIAAKEATLRDLSRSSGLINLAPDSNPTTERLESLNQDYAKAKADRISKEARYRELTSVRDETMSEALSSTLISGLRAELVQLRQEYDAKLKTYRPEYPEMVTLKGRVDKQQQAVNEAIREAVSKARDAAYSDYQTALRTEQNFSRELASATNESLAQNSAAVDYANLLGEIATLRATLNDLQKKQSEASVSSSLQETRESNVHVVDRALVPGGPFRPSLRRELSLGLMLGLVAGLGLVFLLEFLDRTIKDPADLEKLTGLPTLAVIPDSMGGGRTGYGSYGYGYGYGYGARTSHKKGGWLEKRTEEQVAIELLPHARPRLAIAEAYRSLRTALLLSSAEALQVIAVTSAESGEGKTTTAANVAVVMAQLGRRVLLIDGDLRKPKLHEIFQISNRFGVVNLLTAGGKIEEVFLRTAVPNLYVIPAGPIPPNPAELLASERMRDFVHQVRGAFDLVVIDSPPALAVTDPTLIGHLVDGVLLCFAAGKVPREEIRACRDRLVRNEVKILGTVLNRYRSDQGRYGKRYQRYESYGSQAPEEAAKDSAA